MPRTAIADLHAEGDLRDEAVGISAVVANALVRAANAFVTKSDALQVVTRADLMDAVEGAKLPARNGLWLSPTEVRGVADIAHARTVLVGTMRRDAAQVYVTLHLADDDGTVHKTAKLVHPLRTLATLPGAVAERAGRLLGVDVRDVPPVRRMTLAALGRAWIAVQKKDSETAVAELERVAHDPQGDALARPLANLLRTAADGATLRARATMIVDPKAAAVDAEKFAGENPTLMAARLMHARTLIAADRKKDALEALKPRAGDPEASELHYLRGVASGNQAELRKAIELNADNVEAWYALGEHLEAARRYMAARDPRGVTEFLKLIAVQPNVDEAYRALDPSQLLPDEARSLAQAPADSYGRALAQIAAGDLSNTAVLEALHKSAPQDAKVAQLLGLVAAEQGRHDVATEALAKTAPLDAGREARAAGKTQEAQALLTRAVASDEVLALRELADLLQPADAVAKLRKVEAAMPDDADVHATLARVLTAAGDSKGAAAETRLALAIDPELPLNPIADTAKTAPVAKSAAPAQQPAAPMKLPGGLSTVQLAAIGGGVVLLVVLVVVARRRRLPKRERQTFGAMSATDRMPGPPPANPPSKSPATLARAQDALHARPPSGEAHQTANDPPSMPGLASLLIEVVDFASVEIPGTQLTMSEKRPIVGASVWVGGDEAKATRTEQASGAAVLYVPPGEHTLHVRAGAKLLSQVFTVTAPQRIALTVDLADEVVVPRQAHPKT
jgi:tetratricopeptide (TPR) repeat protein